MSEDKNKDIKDVDVNTQSTGEAKKAEDQKKSKSNKKTSKKESKVKVKIDCDNAAGKYGLPQHRGMTVILDESQAKEIEDNKDGRIIK
jgi:1-aminocyclopropane-1-carboxylate deaminase/D-cysteine desulfhydrase-like pyridoxal-dependent ACC family enzyme